MGYANARKFFEDGKIHTFAGTVIVEPDASKHYFVNSEGNFVVSVQVHQHGTLVRANLSTQPGLFVIPDVGAEVMCASDHGDFEGECYLIGQFSATQGLSVDVLNSIKPQEVTVFVSGNINLIVGSGAKIKAGRSLDTVSPVATLEDLQELRDYVAMQFDHLTGHTHATSGSPPTESSIPSTGTATPIPTGTQIFETE